MKINMTAPAIGALMLAACSTPLPKPDNASLQKQVADTERAFAATMARRDLDGFSSFISEDALFYSGGKVTRGKQAVTADWKPQFEESKAPFSWEPDQIDVVDSGTLAMSTGPVRDPQGRTVGRFRSIWRQEAPGQWHIVFDKGERSCEVAH
jgi:ketosteroid isomerase-like protein